VIVGRILDAIQFANNSERLSFSCTFPVESAGIPVGLPRSHHADDSETL
jgi:hypothetical protein